MGDFRRRIFEGATFGSGVFLQLLRLNSTTCRRAAHGRALWTFFLFWKRALQSFHSYNKSTKAQEKKRIISAEGVIAILLDDLQRQGFRAKGIIGTPLGLG